MYRFTNLSNISVHKSFKRFIMLSSLCIVKNSNLRTVLYLPAIKWLKYCRFGVKHHPINQSINLKLHINISVHLLFKKMQTCAFMPNNKHGPNLSIWLNSDLYVRYRLEDLILPHYWSCSVLIILTNQLLL